MSAGVWLASAVLMAALISFLLAGLARRWGMALGLVDQPRPGEVQKEAVPRTGGYAMFASFALALTFCYLTRPVPANLEDDWRVLGVLLGAALILPLAYLDDRRRLGPLPQLVGQMAIALVPVLFGLRLGSIATPLTEPLQVPLWLDIFLTVFWTVGMINAFNWLDTMDGLAAGIAVLAALVLFTRSLWFGQHSIAVLPLVVAGAAAGFLPHNVHPARLFMGTSGSVLLGYSLATASIVGGAKVGTAFAVLAVPILDTAWVILRRLMRGRSPFMGGDQEHLPHKLHTLGLSVRQTVLLLYLLSAALGWLSLSLHSPDQPPLSKLYLLLGMVLVLGGFLALVTRMAVRRQG